MPISSNDQLFFAPSVSLRKSSSAENLKSANPPLFCFPSFRAGILHFWFNKRTTFVLNICGVNSLRHSSLKALKSYLQEYFCYVYWSAHLSFYVKSKLHENIHMMCMFLCMYVFVINWQDVKLLYPYWEIVLLIMCSPNVIFWAG